MECPPGGRCGLATDTVTARRATLGGCSKRGWGVYLATSGDTTWPYAGSFTWPWTQAEDLSPSELAPDGNGITSLIPCGKGRHGSLELGQGGNGALSGFSRAGALDCAGELAHPAIGYGRVHDGAEATVGVICCGAVWVPPVELVVPRADHAGRSGQPAELDLAERRDMCNRSRPSYVPRVLSARSARFIQVPAYCWKVSWPR
jgi:hypothetical protein